MEEKKEGQLTSPVATFSWQPPRTSFRFYFRNFFFRLVFFESCEEREETKSMLSFFLYSEIQFTSSSSSPSLRAQVMFVYRFSSCLPKTHTEQNREEKRERKKTGFVFIFREWKADRQALTTGRAGAGGGGGGDSFRWRLPS